MKEKEEGRQPQEKVVLKNGVNVSLPQKTNTIMNTTVQKDASLEQIKTITDKLSPSRYSVPGADLMADNI